MKLKFPIIKIDQKALTAFFKTDQGILLISMSISFLFWLIIKLSQDYKANREVTIQYRLPDGMAFVEYPPDQIKITLDGPGWDLMYDYFEGNDNLITFNLSSTPIQNITNSQIKQELTKILSSSNLTIFNTDFDYISIELEESSLRKVPIVLNQNLSFVPGFQLKSNIEISPDSINLWGPASLIAAYESWPTTLLQVDNVKDDIEAELELKTNTLPMIELSSSTVFIKVSVEQYTEKSMFLPLSVRNAPDSLKVFPDKVRISFQVGLSQYDTITENHFLLEVDLAGIPVNQTNNTAPILLSKQPAHVKNIRFSPKSVSFLFLKDAD